MQLALLWKVRYVMAQATTYAEAVKGITSPMVWKPSEASFGLMGWGKVK